MRITVPIADGVTLIFTQGELGYQLVLDTLPDAKWVDVVTYNLSENNESLLKLLRNLDVDVELRIITNLPARWKSFHPFAKEAKERFRNMLQTYRAFTDADTFAPNTMSFFNVSNHSKIIMTDRLAYIGSANFSLESQRNFECGVLLSKPEMIEVVRSEFVDVLAKHSAPSNLSLLSEAKLFLKTVRGKLRDLLLEHRDGLDAPLDDMAVGPAEFLWQDARVSSKFLEDFSVVLEDLQDGANAGYEPAQLNELMNTLDIPEIKQLRDLVEHEEDALHRLARWKSDECVDKHWQKYAADAYDDLVNYYMGLAQDDADEEHNELLEAAKVSHGILWDTVKVVVNKTTQVLDQLEGWEKTSWGVDNT